MFGPNIIIATFTVVLAALGGAQWMSYRESLKATKAQLRAYVSFRIKHISHFNHSEAPKFVFECINHGTTPAKDVEFRAIMDLIPKENWNVPTISGPWNPKRMDLFPNSQATNEQRSDITCDCGRIFTSQEIAQIRTGTHNLFIGLEIQYWDVFGEGHKTQTFFLLRADQNAFAWLTFEPRTDIRVTLPKDMGQIGFTIIPGTSKFT